MMRRGVIAAGHRLTAEAGADVLRDGGNAVDAAIAAVAMACVCEPVLCSPGGGAFAMVRAPDRSVVVLDAFPHTPLHRSTAGSAGMRSVYADFGTARQAFRVGPATAATPGLFDGLAALGDRFGTRPVGVAVAAAAHAARAGVVITPFQHHLCSVVESILTATPNARELFTIDGELMPTGATFHNPGLADALELLAVDGFAESAVGDAALHQQQRGHLTRDDLAAFEVVAREPHEVWLGDDLMMLNPLPAAGGALVARILGQLSSAAALELAVAIDVTGADLRGADGQLVGLASLPVRRRGTTHVSVVDEDGLACSITTSNGEGNGELVDGFGFMLNNVLGEDDVNPQRDDWPTDTRLSSMMCPTIIEHADGAITALGSGGSSRIPSAISQVAAQLCLRDADLRRAVDAPRVYADRGHLDLELREDAATMAALCRAFPDHRIWPTPDLFYGGVHVARRGSGGDLAGAGDRRRDGVAVIVD